MIGLFWRSCREIYIKLRKNTGKGQYPNYVFGKVRDKTAGELINKNKNK
jgi:hypothetical protein